MMMDMNRFMVLPVDMNSNIVNLSVKGTFLPVFVPLVSKNGFKGTFSVVFVLLTLMVIFVEMNKVRQICLKLVYM